jgi:cytochrome P450
MAASTEMVSNELSWGIYALSLPQNQHVQERLREAIRGKFPDCPKDLTYAELADIPYLTYVVNEILRLYPSVAHRYRECHVITTLLGTTIPRGTTLTWPVYAMNRDSALWGADATGMRPERWLDGGSLPAEQYAFMTFGQGVRKCPGEQYARLAMACMLFGLIGRFKFELPDGADVMAHGGKAVAFGIVMKTKVLANVDEVLGWDLASEET